MISLAANAPSRAQRSSGSPARIAGQKTSREQIARARRIDEVFDRRSGNLIGLAPLTTTAPFSDRVIAARTFSCRRAATRGVEIGRFVKRVQFRFIGEQDIDNAVADQPQEFLLMAVDAKHVGKVRATSRPAA